MRKIKRDAKLIQEILKLSEKGWSYREISAKLSVGIATISRTIEAARMNNVTTYELAKMDAKTSESIFIPSKNTSRQLKELPDFEEIHVRISKVKHRSLKHEWDDYIELNPVGYSYPRFLQYYKEWCKENCLSPVLLANEPCGENMYVDWAGDTVTIPHLDEGDNVTIYFFVTSVGASQYPYVEPFRTMRIQSYIDGHCNAFEYYGAIPKYVVPDNCKTAVIYNRGYDIELNTVYAEMEAFYKCMVKPARVRKPTDKNDVENNVRIIEDYIIGDVELHKNEFHSFKEVQDYCRKKLEKFVTGKKFRRTANTRREWFKRVDLPNMLPLPQTRFALYAHQEMTVPRNYHVHIKGDAHRYSVPYTWIGEQVMIKYTYSVLKVFDSEGTLIVEWDRSHDETLDTVHTRPEHRPKNHQVALEYKAADAEKYLEAAEKIGPFTYKVIETMLNSRENPNVMFRACQGVIYQVNSKKGVTKEMLESVCEQAYLQNRCHYGFVRDTITELLNARKDEEGTLPEHENIRPNQYY